MCGDIIFLIELLKKNKFKNLLIIVQIVISVFYLTFFLIPITEAIDTDILMKKLNMKNDIAFFDEAQHISFLPENYNFEKMDMSDIQSLTECLEPNLSSRVRIIPYKHVGDNNAGMILGIKADYLDVDNKKISNIILGVSNFNDEGYSAILNPRILY